LRRKTGREGGNRRTIVKTKKLSTEKRGFRIEISLEGRNEGSTEKISGINAGDEKYDDHDICRERPSPHSTADNDTPKEKN